MPKFKRQMSKQTSGVRSLTLSNNPTLNTIKNLLKLNPQLPKLQNKKISNLGKLFPKTRLNWIQIKRLLNMMIKKLKILTKREIIKIRECRKNILKEAECKKSSRNFWGKLCSLIDWPLFKMWRGHFLMSKFWVFLKGLVSIQRGTMMTLLWIWIWSTAICPNLIP